MSNKIALADLLKKEREARQIESGDLAKSLGFHPHVIEDWEQGKRHPRFKSAVRWADALGFKIEIARRA